MIHKSKSDTSLNVDTEEDPAELADPDSKRIPLRELLTTEKRDKYELVKIEVKEKVDMASPKVTRHKSAVGERPNPNRNF